MIFLWPEIIFVKTVKYYNQVKNTHVIQEIFSDPCYVAFGYKVALNQKFAQQLTI